VILFIGNKKIKQMKYLMLLVLIICCSQARVEHIPHAEYFRFNTDPGTKRSVAIEHGILRNRTSIWVYDSIVAVADSSGKWTVYSPEKAVDALYKMMRYNDSLNMDNLKKLDSAYRAIRYLKHLLTWRNPDYIETRQQ